MGMGTLDAYVADLEEPLLVNTREHYARKSQEWIETDSTPDYMIKVQEKRGPGTFSCLLSVGRVFFVVSICFFGSGIRAGRLHE